VSTARHVIFGTGAIGLATYDALRRRGESVLNSNAHGPPVGRGPAVASIGETPTVRARGIGVPARDGGADGEPGDEQGGEHDREQPERRTAHGTPRADHTITRPPVMSSVTPVTQDDTSDAR
jgi:hypothetical protein